MNDESSELHKQLESVSLAPAEIDRVMTPALVIYPDIVDANISATLKLLDGNIERWQPHVKTAKLWSTMRQFCDRGVKRFKCATTLEMLTACEAGAEEVLMSYPSTGTRAKRVREIAASFPKVQICATVENAHQIEQWRASAVSLYIDINPGMNRTGIEQSRSGEIVELARCIVREGIPFAGLHYYDGHNRQANLEERRALAFQGYEQLLKLVQALRDIAIPVKTLITSGTPALPCAIAFPAFRDGSIEHRVSPGTVVYNDLASMSQLPHEWGYRFGAIVVSSVISQPAPGLITCDAGHKAVSSDAGFPNCIVLGRPELEPQHPSEEHLPIRVPEGVPIPEIGDCLYLVPKHVCTTVNNFDTALLARNGRVFEVARVSARGRESHLMDAAVHSANGHR